MYYLQNLPLILMFSIGILLSLLHFSKNRKIAIISLTSFTIFLSHALITPYMYAHLPLMLINSGKTASEVGSILAILNGVISVIMMFPWTLILVSIFQERKK